MIRLPFRIKQRMTFVLVGACIGPTTAAFGAQGQSDAVQALLAKVKQVALACRVVAG